jgi:hypothetical protein
MGAEGRQSRRSSTLGSQSACSVCLQPRIDRKFVPSAGGLGQRRQGRAGHLCRNQSRVAVTAGWMVYLNRQQGASHGSNPSSNSATRARRLPRPSHDDNTILTGMPATCRRDDRSVARSSQFLCYWSSLLDAGLGASVPCRGWRRAAARCSGTRSSRKCLQ